MNETEFKKFLIEGTRYIVGWSLIEAHMSQPGIPDLGYVTDGVWGYVETKVDPKLRNTQWLWMKEQMKYGGHAIVVWLHYEYFYLIRSDAVVLEQLHLTKSVNRWKAASSMQFRVDLPRWFEFQWCLKHVNERWVDRPNKI